MPEKPYNFWEELKRRKVPHVITIYIAGAFGLLEMADIVSDYINIPDFVIYIIMIAAIVGFPLAIIYSWLFISTPGGIKLRKNIDKIQWHEISHNENDIDIDEGYMALETGEMVPELIPSGEKLNFKSKRGKVYMSGSFVVIFVSVALFLFFSGKSIPFEERDLVVIADFKNLTGEEIFDNSLNTAYEISIDQSHHVNVVPYKRKQEVLKRIGKEPGTIIDDDLCRDIAIIEGAKAYITPEISRVGKQYILSSKLQETENGILITSLDYYCDSQDKILGTLDRMSKRIRRYLGESRYKMTGQSKPLEKATTSSIDALKQFSRGQECMNNMDYENAVAHFRMAIGLDSSFTTAKASLGSLLCEYYDPVEGKKWLDEAIRSIDNLTDSEKYSILVVYAVHVEKDLEKSIMYNKILIELHPERAGYRINLALDLFDQGRFEEAVIEYKHAVRLDPNNIMPYSGLTYTYNSKLRQIDSALYWAQRMISISPENQWGHFYLGVCYFERDELEKARYEFEKVREISPGIKVNLYNLAHTLIALDKFELAIEIFKNIEGARAIYDLGLCYEVMGADKLAIIQYEKYLSILESEAPDTPVNLIAKGIVLTRLGRKEEGMEIGRRGFELDSTLHYSFAQLLAVQQYPEQALYHLEKAFENGYWDLVEIKMNQELSSLKNDERYRRLIELYVN